MVNVITKKIKSEIWNQNLKKIFFKNKLKCLLLNK